MSTQRAESGTPCPRAGPGSRGTGGAPPPPCPAPRADRRHRLRADEERHHAADEQADHDHRVDEVEARGPQTDRRGVGAEERQRGERGRADREALADRGGGVAERVEAVGDLAVSLPRWLISVMPPALSAIGP
jgi:hypothetical protein